MSFHLGELTHLSEYLKPMKQTDILWNIPQSIPQDCPFVLISEQIILVTECIWFSKIGSVKRKRQAYFY